MLYHLLTTSNTDTTVSTSIHFCVDVKKLVSTIFSKTPNYRCAVSVIPSISSSSNLSSGPMSSSSLSNVCFLMISSEEVDLAGAAALSNSCQVTNERIKGSKVC